jgi:6-phosphogluconolactonase (cycloisomerase 2 family)
VITSNGRYLYNLNSGTHTISSFRIQPDGSLAPLPTLTNVPLTATGLVSR